MQAGVVIKPHRCSMDPIPAVLSLANANSRPCDIAGFHHVGRGAERLPATCAGAGTFLLLTRNGDGFQPGTVARRGSHTVLFAGTFQDGLRDKVLGPSPGRVWDGSRLAVTRPDADRPVEVTDILFSTDAGNLGRFHWEFGVAPRHSVASFQEFLVWQFATRGNAKHAGARFLAAELDADQVDLTLDGGLARVVRPRAVH